MNYLKLLVFVAVCFSCNNKEVEKERYNEVFEMLDFYESIAGDSLPKLNLKDDRCVLKINSKSPGFSYLINVDSSFMKYFIQSKFVNNEYYGIIEYLEDEYVCCDFHQGRYENGDSLYLIYGDRSYLNIYLLEDYLKDNPNDSRIDWLGVFIHELSHLTEKYEKPDSIPEMFDLIIRFEEDSLFRQMIHKENEKLLSAINAHEEGQYLDRDDRIQEYYDLRNERINSFGYRVIDYEKYYELIEGYARYIEYLGKNNAGEYFNKHDVNYDMKDESFMYSTKSGNAYFYAIGFNKIRLLTLKNDYTFVESIIGNSRKSLDDYLKLK